MSAANTRLIAAAPALLDAVEYMLGRIHADPDIGYYCGFMTEAFVRLCGAYAQAHGESPSIVGARFGVYEGDAEVVRLRREIEELRG